MNVGDVTIKDNSKECIEAMSQKIEKALTMIGIQAEGYAKGELSGDYGAPKRVDTGNLRNSVNYVVKDDAVYIGTNVEYAPYVHEGTDRMDPNRFLRNAAEKHVSEYKQMIRDEMR